MINLKINNSDVTVKEGSTIMEAAEKVVFLCHISAITKSFQSQLIVGCAWLRLKNLENLFRPVLLQLLRVCKYTRIQRLQKRRKRV